MKQTVDDATAIVAKKPNYFVWGSLFVVFCILAGTSYQLSETKPVFFREMSVGALVAFSAALLSYAAASFREKITDIEPEVRIVPTSSRSKFLQEALTVSWSVFHSGHWATYIRDNAFIGWAEKATNENKVFNLKLALIDPTHDQAVGSFVAYRNATYRAKGAILPQHLQLSITNGRITPSTFRGIDKDYVTAQICCTIASVAVLTERHPNFHVEVFLRPWFSVIRTETIDGAAIITQDPKDTSPIHIVAGSKVASDIARGFDHECALSRVVELKAIAPNSSPSTDSYCREIYQKVFNRTPNLNEISIFKEQIAKFWAV